MKKITILIIIFIIGSLDINAQYQKAWAKFIIEIAKNTVNSGISSNNYSIIVLGDQELVKQLTYNKNKKINGKKLIISNKLKKESPSPNIIYIGKKMSYFQLKNLIKENPYSILISDMSDKVGHTKGGNKKDFLVLPYVHIWSTGNPYIYFFWNKKNFQKSNIYLSAEFQQVFQLTNTNIQGKNK